MLELFVVACVSMRACEYITVPMSYPTAERCQQQGALLAGMVRGRFAGIGNDLTYKVECRPWRTAWLQPLPSDDIADSR